MTSGNLLMSSAWADTLVTCRNLREAGHPQTHMQCAPYQTPLHVPDKDRFLEQYFNYHATLPKNPSAAGAKATLNSITEKLSPDKPFPFFVDLDFDPEWFGPSPGPVYVTMDVPFAFSLIEDTIALFGQLIKTAYALDEIPVHLLSLRAFYKCHVHFHDVFVDSKMASSLTEEACRLMVERHPDFAPNIKKAFDAKVYTAGLRLLGSHKGKLGKPDGGRVERENHEKYLAGHYYNQQYLLSDFDAINLCVTPRPLTLEALKLASVHREGKILPVSPSCTFMTETNRNRNKRKFVPAQISNLPIDVLDEDAGWEDVARVFVSGALREANMDPGVTRVRKYANTGFIEVTLSPRECPMKSATHKRTQERGGSANYVLIGLAHVFLRCWKCEASLQLEDTPDRLSRLMDLPAQRRHYKLFASLHDNTHELVTNVLFEAMKDTYSVAAISDNKFIWYYFDAGRHRWIQYEKVMTAIMEDKGAIQNMWTDLVKLLKREMVPAEGAAVAGGKVEIYETVILRKLLRNLQNVGFIKNSIMALLARKIDWHWRQKTTSCTPFQMLLDSIPHLIGFSNGVYDTKLCLFREGKPSDFISKSTHVDYTPWAEQPRDLCEGLMGFLSQVQSKPDELDYLIYAIASSFRGDAAVRQAFFFWIGLGANAKSTIIRMINQAMGDYACETPVTLFTRERPSSEKPCPEIVATRGCRFASAPEPGLSDEFVMSTLKWLSGSDKLTGRRLNENMQSWYGSVTYHCCMNGIPLITSKDEDYGTWRRLIVILFESRFVPNPSGPREFKKMESAEFEDKIRSWAIPFASLLIDSIAKKAAVPLPLSFAKATENLKLKNDIIGKFVAHSVTVDDSTFCEVMEAFSAFNTFKRMANVKGRAVTEEQFTLYLSTNVAPLRTRLNNNKEENGWGIVIKTCGGDRGYGFN